MDFLTLAKDRFSARTFTDTAIPQADIDQIIGVGTLCAHGGELSAV